MEPIIELAGKLRFGLPGTPIFPVARGRHHPAADARLAGASRSASEALGRVGLRHSGPHVESGLQSRSPEQGDIGDIAGWVTVQNQSGTTFQNARLKLMAGEVEKVHHPERREAEAHSAMLEMVPGGAGEVEEKAFDEYHLYTLPRATTLRDAETKQVEFTRAAGVKTSRVYSFDGAGPVHIFPTDFNPDPNPVGVRKPKVVTELEFKNSAENRLGVPLPAGRLRVYRRDGEQLEFVGEQNIEHTPKEELVRVKLGAAFDLVGERQQVDFQSDEARRMADESFEIKLRNRSERAVEIRVIEHLYRGPGWTITAQSQPFTKADARTIHFQVPLQPGEEKTVTYTVHYTW
jgi:hypothetical protein